MLLDLPIELRYPTSYKRVIHNFDSLLDFINKMNGRTDIFVNLYTFNRSFCCQSKFKKVGKKYFCMNCKKPLVQELNKGYPVINTIAFDLDPDDFDSEEDMYEAMIRLVVKFEDYNTFLNFSGSGFHFYIDAKLSNDNTLEEKKNALKAFQIETGKELDINFDYHLHGDTSRILRVPGTINTKRGNYCYNITKIKSLEEIKKDSYEFHPIEMKYISKGKIVDLNDYIGRAVKHSTSVVELSEQRDVSNDTVSILRGYGIVYDELTPCVQLMFRNPFMSYNERYMFIKILRAWGLSLDATKSILWNVLWSTPIKDDPIKNKQYNWARHSVIEERQPDFIYSNEFDYPTCIYLNSFMGDYCNNCGRDILEMRQRKI